MDNKNTLEKIISIDCKEELANYYRQLKEIDPHILLDPEVITALKEKDRSFAVFHECPDGSIAVDESTLTLPARLVTDEDLLKHARKEDLEYLQMDAALRDFQKNNPIFGKLINIEKGITQTSETPVPKPKASPSPEMQRVLQRLNEGKDVSLQEINCTPEMRHAKTEYDRIAKNINRISGQNVPLERVKTTQYKDTAIWAKRETLQRQIAEKLDHLCSARYVYEHGRINVKMDGEIECGKHMDIVIGSPASGKSSSVAEKLSAIHHARIIDNDDAKRMIPEFKNGFGTDIVHPESQDISKVQIQQALKRGENIVLPKVGNGIDGIAKIMDNAQALGYTFSVHYVELPKNKALSRLLSRQVETGRYLNPELVLKCFTGDKCNIEASYEVLKQMDGVHGYSKWNNDVEIGKEPILEEMYGLPEIGINYRKDEGRGRFD